jgi:preprotein translocase subunit YajC
MWSDAFAQAAGAAPSVNPAVGMLVQFGPILLIFVIMYFLLIRPQQEQAKKTKTMLEALGRGDRVVTSGGMLGTVVDVKDDGRVVLKVSDDVKMEFLKSAVVQVLTEKKS